LPWAQNPDRPRPELGGSDATLAKKARHVEYAQRFAENGIGFAALRHLTDQDLKTSECCSDIGG